MTKIISAAIASLLFSGAMSAYSNANINFDTTLDCTSCIRGGYDFCLTIGGTTTATVTSWTCLQKPHGNPEI